MRSVVSTSLRMIMTSQNYRQYLKQKNGTDTLKISSLEMIMTSQNYGRKNKILKNKQNILLKFLYENSLCY